MKKGTSNKNRHRDARFAEPTQAPKPVAEEEKQPVSPEPEAKRESGKKEPSQGWLKFRAKAGAGMKSAGKKLGALLAALFKRMGRSLAANFRMEKGKALGVLRDGLFVRNPLLVLVLGVTCALLASTNLKNAVVMGVCTLAVLFCSAFVISVTRKVLPEPVRKVTNLLVIGAFTTVAWMLVRLLFPQNAEELGIYLPLVAVNSVLLTRAEHFAAQNTPGYALLDALSTGVGYGVALALLGAVRELLGAGTLWGVPLFGTQFHPALLVAAPCGGFLVLGILTAAAQWLGSFGRKKGGDEA